MPVDIEASNFLDLDAAVPSDTIAVGVDTCDAVVVALEGRDGTWVAYQGSVEDARDLAFALLEKVNLIESRGYAQV